MDWKKISLVLAVVVSIAGLGKGIMVAGRSVYQFTVKVDSAFAAIEKTDRRHSQEDLVFLWKRKADLEDKRDRGDWMPSDVDALLRLNTIILDTEKELGY